MQLFDVSTCEILETISLWVVFKGFSHSRRRYSQRGNRAKKLSCLGDRFLIPLSVGKNSHTLHNLLKFTFLPYLGVSKTPYLGSEVMNLYLQLRLRNCFFCFGNLWLARQDGASRDQLSWSD